MGEPTIATSHGVSLRVAPQAPGTGYVPAIPESGRSGAEPAIDGTDPTEPLDYAALDVKMIRRRKTTGNCRCRLDMVWPNKWWRGVRVLEPLGLDEATFAVSRALLRAPDST